MYDTRAALDFLRSHDSFIVIGHKEPDGDCLASQLALASLIRAMGKEATLHSAGPFDRPEISSYAAAFSAEITDARRSGVAVVIVDCSTPERTGSLGARVQGLPSLVVDHHSSGEPFGDARMVEPEAPSTTMLIFQLFEDAGVSPDRETARLLLFGLCTDTGFFRHLARNVVETFSAVSRLAARGTSTAEVYMMVYGMRDLSTRRLLAEMLARTESRWGDRLLLTWQTVADRERLSAHQRGDDDLYRLLQTITGNVVVVLVKEESEGVFSVGLRSTSAIDVGAVAASFGGGGHKQAAGFDIHGDLETVKKTLIDAFAPCLSEM
jgi:bifunctional oligoribonuclease and PAP phosphatase NrnA